MSTVYLDMPAIDYPDSDGQPMADNSRQYEYTVTIKGGLDVVFAANPDVFVAGEVAAERDQAEQRADREQKRADQLAALLCQHGIDPIG